MTWFAHCLFWGTPYFLTWSLVLWLSTAPNHVQIEQMLPIFMSFLVCSWTHFRSNKLCNLFQKFCTSHPIRYAHWLCEFSEKRGYKSLFASQWYLTMMNKSNVYVSSLHCLKTLLAFWTMIGLISSLLFLKNHQISHIHWNLLDFWFWFWHSLSFSHSWNFKPTFWICKIISQTEKRHHQVCYSSWAIIP